MAELKKVLLVDDHFEMLDFLRSMLELSSQNYDVLAVPSAEEGLLELRQKEFDLVITDVRLPGMSGFEFVRNIRRIKPTVPTIMITAYSSEQGRREAAELGVHRYFRKPLDTDEVLAAVHTALYGELVVHADTSGGAGDIDVEVPEEVPRRLETLRADTGSTRIALGTSSGKILLQVGQGPGMNLFRLSRLIATNLDNSFLLTQELGGSTPITIQYHAGDKIELYIANVGRDYFLAIFFDAQTRRGRMGTIWVFAQRAIKDLLAMLPRLDLSRRNRLAGDIQQTPGSRKLEDGEGGETTPSAAEQPARQASTQKAREEPVGAGQPADSGPKRSASSSLEGLLASGDTTLEDSADLEKFWDDSRISDAGVSPGTDQLSYEEAQREGLIPEKLAAGSHEGASDQTNAAESTSPDNVATGRLPLGDDDQAGFPIPLQVRVDESVDLEEFWDDAIADDRRGDMTPGFSWEEAKRRGLVSDQLNFEDEAE